MIERILSANRAIALSEMGFIITTDVINKNRVPMVGKKVGKIFGPPNEIFGTINSIFYLKKLLL